MDSLLPIEKIASTIFLIRKEKVLLDSDLAELYGVETKALKQAVRRNQKRFPNDFMFQLTRDEYRSLRSQIVTLKKRAAFQLSTLRIHRTGCCNVVWCFKQRQSN